MYKVNIYTNCLFRNSYFLATLHKKQKIINYLTPEIRINNQHNPVITIRVSICSIQIHALTGSDLAGSRPQTDVSYRGTQSMEYMDSQSFTSGTKLRK